MIAPRDPHLPLTLGEREELERRWPNAERLAAAIAIALDVEACADLLAGRPVVDVRLDPVELEKALRASLVQMVRPVDVLIGAAV